MRTLMLIGLMGFTSFAQANCSTQLFSGKALDIKTQKVLYQEDYQRVWENDRLARDQVQYRDPQNKIFASKRVLYNSGLSHPSFKLVDQRSNYIEAAELKNSLTQVQYQTPGQSSITQSQLALPDNAVHDAGFNELVQKNWQDLQQGKSIPMQFLAPSRADYLNFVITPAEKQSAGKLQVILSATNKIFQWAIGPIELTYDANTRQLLQFKGLTNIKNNQGKNYRARIDYVYQAKQNGVCPADLADGSRRPTELPHESRTEPYLILSHHTALEYTSRLRPNVQCANKSGKFACSRCNFITAFRQGNR